MLITGKIRQKSRKVRSLSVMILAGMIVMASLSGCGKTKEATVVAEATDTEVEATVPETASVEEPVVSEPTPTPTPTPEVTPEKEEEKVTAEETSEEASSEELTVDMTKVKAFDAAKTMYAIKNVNARKGPSTDFDTLGMIKTGEAVEAIGQDAEGWYEIKYKNEIAFASNDFLSEEAPATPEAADLTAQEATDPLTATNPQAAAQTAQQPAADTAVQVPAKVVTAPAGVLIIGDSRCVQMRDVTGGGGCSWICQKAKGYSWFESTAIPQADESVGKGTKVVIAMGVNDVGDINSYAALVNAKAAEWAARGAKTYFVSVNPVWENPYVTEDEVIAFNSTMPGLLVGVKWIDTHSYLVANGYNMVDGMHYDDETNLRVFQAIVGSLR